MHSTVQMGRNLSIDGHSMVWYTSIIIEAQINLILTHVHRYTQYKTNDHQKSPVSLRCSAMIMSVTDSNTNCMLLVSVAHVT